MTREIKKPWIETPLVRSTNLSKAAGCNVFLKLENTQPSGSFKSRGIGHYMVDKLTTLRQQRNDPSVKAHFYSSSGANAGLACIYGANVFECRTTIVTPLSTSAFLVAKLKQAGAVEVIQYGNTWPEADEYLRNTVMMRPGTTDEARIYVPPFDAPEIWQGNAGIMHEIVRQLGEAISHYSMNTATTTTTTTTTNGKTAAEHAPNIDAVVCSVGGGSLFCGLMQAIEELQMKDRTQVITVEADGVDSLAQSVAKRERITLSRIGSLATSLGARRVAQRAFEYGLEKHVRTVVLSDAEAIRACRRFADEEHYLVELACSVCPALCYNGKLAELIPGFNENTMVVIVVCGGSNISFEMMGKYLATLG
ncbi:tryptophan synthase beta subunit-like PLP-dependent enzyme [Aspergillus pseudotamarii]|uniref:L-serine ammonia-lyase n=1 Tax=Aspergillus pseudotamarii TaxID=132259 RepID=A0A5N6TB33_ASPPS|nr:tryptophan synthase beta subunit-like PLP-dependent enzyme [Aspergillus pseudotamarii]KAE8143588.1 tryptophan synthase beta subunit-like PLP-dependent enzyme [Aspergillus pseudotamarii]